MNKYHLFFNDNLSFYVLSIFPLTKDSLSAKWHFSEDYTMLQKPGSHYCCTAVPQIFFCQINVCSVEQMCCFVCEHSVQTLGQDFTAPLIPFCDISSVFNIPKLYLFFFFIQLFLLMLKNLHTHFPNTHWLLNSPKKERGRVEAGEKSHETQQSIMSSLTDPESMFSGGNWWHCRFETLKPPNIINTFDQRFVKWAPSPPPPNLTAHTKNRGFLFVVFLVSRFLT